MYIEDLIVEKIDKASILKNPTDHCVIENFLPEDVATLLSQEFPAPESDAWHVYNNIAEDKKTCNQWNLFKAMTYKYFAAACSRKVTDAIGIKFNIELDPDIGLHGGGQHFHSKSGNLNPHLDYSIHPKLGLERRINLIYYLTDKHNEKDGGHFGLWGNNSSEYPGDLIKEICPKFNTAVIFDTSQNSWHGMSRIYNPKLQYYRKSLASYYVSQVREGVSGHTRALFAPRQGQNHEEVKDFAERRSSEAGHKDAYTDS